MSLTGTLYFLQGVETATSEFAGLGAKVIPAIIIYAVSNIFSGICAAFSIL